MSSGGKKPYLDFQKYKYDEKKRSLFSFFEKKRTPNKKLKIFETQTPQDALNFQVGNNPFRKESKKKINFRQIFYPIFISSFFIAWFWLMFYLPYFYIDNISYYGIKVLNAEEIKNFVFENYLKSGKYWHKNNYFVIKPKKIASAIKENFDISDVQVIKIFPDILKIDIIEKNQSIVFCTSEGYYLLDEKGSVIKIFWEKEIPILENQEIIDTTVTTSMSLLSSTSSIKEKFKPSYTKVDIQYQDLPLFCISEDKKIEKDQRNILTDKHLEAINYWQSELKKQGIAKTGYFLGQENHLSGAELYLQDKKWYLKITFEDIDKQIIKLKTILEQEGGINLPKEYIDLRFEDRVYWK